MTLRLL